MGNITATDEDVINAAKQAGCHEFIASLSEGYETAAGNAGNKLSGGQKQRIAIARAILSLSVCCDSSDLRTSSLNWAM